MIYSHPCAEHKHPSLQQPISPERFQDELAAVVFAARKGLQENVFSHKFCDDLSKTHQRNSRRYAEVDLKSGVFIFAVQTLWLPAPNRLGLLAHEVGHKIANRILGPNHTEAQADEAAKHYCRVAITYDTRWPGKGLQHGRLLR